MDLLVGLILFSLAVYTILPDIFLHRLGIGSFKRSYSPGVTITIDDGPDPSFTPRVLQILDTYQTSATFFVVGEKARRHPELIQEIISRGHQIGAHSMSHTHSWTQLPLKTWRDWQKTVNTLESITGSSIDFIRPPWGTFNLALLAWFKYYHKRAVLWSAKGYDWQVRRSPEEIAANIEKKLGEGCIILLHDSGGETGAPENSILALEIICKAIREKHKLPIVPLYFPDWTWVRRMGFSLWQKWEHFYAGLNRVERIDSTNMFRLAQKRYKGPKLYNHDGELMASEGDLVAELHLDSIRFQANGADSQTTGLKALRQVRDSLPALAGLLASPEYKDIKVLTGVTLLNRGVKGLGFEVEELPPSLRRNIVGNLQKVIMLVYHPLRKSNRRLGEPKLVWISKDKLIERWLPTDDKNLHA